MIILPFNENSMFIVILIFLIFTFYPCLCDEPIKIDYKKTGVHRTSAKSPDLFDNLEQEMYATGVDKEVDIPPPSRLEIILRRIGSPLLICYAFARQRIIQWFTYYKHRWFCS